jgi:TolA-binding protein
VQALAQAVSLLRGKHDAPAALAALDDYLARFPVGALAPEARVARVDALLLLGREDEALGALEQLPLDAHRRSTELQLIRGELRARTDCGRAEADFTAVLARVQSGALEERALYGRAACRSTLGRTSGAADDLRQYVERFPTGTHAGWARRWLENNR